MTDYGYCQVTFWTRSPPFGPFQGAAILRGVIGQGLGRDPMWLASGGLATIQNRWRLVAWT